MKTIASLAAVVIIIALPTAALPSGDQSAPTGGAKPAVAEGAGTPGSTAGGVVSDPKDSPLVRAAKAARAANAARPKSNKPVKILTNADVKKSHGKLTLLPPRPGMMLDEEPADMASPRATPGMLEKQRQELETRKREAKKVAELTTATAELESALNRLEDEYYRSDDPMYRDNVIQKKFNDTKKELETSREELHKAQRAQKESLATSAAPHG